MGVSVWQIMMIVVYVVIPVAALMTTSKTAVLNRMEYFVRFLTVIGAVVVLSAIPAMFAVPGEMLSAVSALLILVVAYFLFTFHVKRMQDTGKSRYFVLFGVVPIANLILLAYLLFMPSREA